MATYASVVTGNLTTNTTWALCDATAENDSVAANTVLTTSYVESSAFTPGAITIDAIGVKIALRPGTTGTITIRLAQAGATVAGTEVAINVSDIAACDTAANGGGGWYFFKFAAPVLLVAATAYTVSAKTSSSTQVNLFSSATTNWSRQLRTTDTSATPTTGDKFMIQGEWTAAATSSSFTVTMNETATTAYGNVNVSNKGTLAYDTAGGFNYYLKCQDVNVWSGGTFTIGTTGSKMPSNSTAVLEFNCASSGQYRFQVRSGATIIMQGNPITSFKSLMTADSAATATGVTVVDTTGWVANDVLVFPTTTRTASQCENKTIQSVTNSTTLVLSAGLTNAHSGTAPTQCEVGNITRNIKVRGITQANNSSMRIWPGSVTVVDVDYVEFYNFADGTFSAWRIEATGASISFRYSSVHDSTSAGGGPTCECTGWSGTGIEISDNIIYNNGGVGIQVNAGTGGVTVNNNLVLKTATNSGIRCDDMGSTITNNRCAGNASLGIDFGNFSAEYAALGAFSGNIAHGNVSAGFNLGHCTTGTISNITSWRNNSYGIIINSGVTIGYTSVIYDTATLFGNTTANINFASNVYVLGSVIFKSYTMDAGVTLTCPVGILFDATISSDNLFFENCNFGTTTTHATADLRSTATTYLSAQFYNCNFASSTEFSQNTFLLPIGYAFKGVGSTKHDTTAGAAKNWSRFGIQLLDTAFSNTASPSLRMTPNDASNKLLGAFKTVPVISGGTVTVSAYVRKSVIGDGTAYNGNQPRLMLRKNLELGITSDTVIATATNGANGAWELQTGTTGAASADGVFEFYVDCDGTTGWINVDDFTTTSSLDPSGLKYWINGNPITGNSSSGGGVSGGSFTFC